MRHTNKKSFFLHCDHTTPLFFFVVCFYYLIPLPSFCLFRVSPFVLPCLLSFRHRHPSPFSYSSTLPLFTLHAARCNPTLVNLKLPQQLSQFVLSLPQPPSASQHIRTIPPSSLCLCLFFFLLASIVLYHSLTLSPCSVTAFASLCYFTLPLLCANDLFFSLSGHNSKT